MAIFYSVFRPVTYYAISMAVLALALAVAIILTAPRRRMNRAAGVLLIISAVLQVASTLRHEPAVSLELRYALAGLFFFCAATSGGTYLLVLSQLPGPFTRWLTWGRAVAALVSLAVLAGAALVLLPDRVHEDAGAVRNEMMAFPATFGLLVSVYGLIAAISAWRRAEHETTRQQAAAFMFAFGGRDAIIAMALIVNLLYVATGDFGIVNDAQAYGGFANSLPNLAELIFLPLLAYGILRAQLFDFDNRVLLTASGALAFLVLISVFVVVTETIEASIARGSQTIAVLSAVVLALTFRPLQNFCEGRLRRRFPNARPLQAMPKADREAAFARQVVLAYQDDVVTRAEARMLEDLAAQLGIPEQRRRALEKRHATRAT